MIKNSHKLLKTFLPFGKRQGTTTGLHRNFPISNHISFFFVDKNHLELMSMELRTCIIKRMLASSAPPLVGRLRWWFNIWYTCSKIGRTCIAIIGSVGFIPVRISLIHVNFRGVSLLISQANCCRRERSTPWLKGRGFTDKIPGKSTWPVANNTLRVKRDLIQSIIRYYCIVTALSSSLVHYAYTMGDKAITLNGSPKCNMRIKTIGIQNIKACKTAQKQYLRAQPRYYINITHL